MILGAHVSTAGGAFNAPLNAQELGITAFQMFTKNQNRWSAKPFTDEDIRRFLTTCEECGIESKVAHDAYLINLCAVDAANLHRSREAFVDELIRADQLQLDGLIMHPGSHLNAGEEAGLRRIAESFHYCFDHTPDGEVRVLLETTAGQGTNLGYRFEQLAELMRLIGNPQRIGICVDTCHIYAAGYDYSTREGYEAVIQQFDAVIGLGNLYAFHLNDSKKPMGSRVDRHEHIGQGEIGLEAISFFLNDPRFETVPGLLETPGELEDYERNLANLRTLLEARR